LSLHQYIKEHPHGSTILGYFWPRGPRVTYERETVETPDQDFFHIDWLGKNERGPLLIILHGLEGSSNAAYMRRLAHLAGQRGYRVAALNHRSCSGIDNRTVRCYHSGFTDDIALFIKKQTQAEPQNDIYMAGFSLGGSILANYLGRFERKPQIKAAVICSTPYYLAPGAKALQTGFTQVYELKFLLSLKRKAKQKMKKHKEATPWALKTFKAKTLEDFDHYWTAPSFGFQSSDDYYEQASSAPYLKNISVPTLALHAQDDPIVVPDCVPETLLNDNPNIRFEKYAFGGHMGFWEKEPNWLSHQIINFLDQKKAGL
jgi:uncharacterized protein